MRTIILGVGLVLALAVPAQAQTHPCDQAASATVLIQSGAPHKVQFCAKATDNVEALLGLVDSQPFDLVPITSKTPTPSATGLTLYESGPFVQVPKGQHTLTLRLYNKNAFTGQLQLGAVSLPFAFSADDDTPPAEAPKILNIIR
jgi:hypothetical protein